MGSSRKRRARQRRPELECHCNQGLHTQEGTINPSACLYISSGFLKTTKNGLPRPGGILQGAERQRASEDFRQESVIAAAQHKMLLKVWAFTVCGKCSTEKKWSHSTDTKHSDHGKCSGVWTFSSFVYHLVNLVGHWVQLEYNNILKNSWDETLQKLKVQLFSFKGLFKTHWVEMYVFWVFNIFMMMEIKI